MHKRSEQIFKGYVTRYPDNCPQEKLFPRLGLELGLRFVLGLGAGQFSARCNSLRTMLDTSCLF